MLFAVLLAGCRKAEIPETVALSHDGAGESSFSGRTVLGDEVRVPYEISNMREAMRQLASTRSDCPEGELLPNALYVRFLPESLEEYLYLTGELKLNLYDYPLHREIKVRGSYYHDPDIPEDKITWQYTAVPYDFAFPEGVVYEILQEAYIPGFTDAFQTRGVELKPYDEELERVAARLCGFGDLLESDAPTTRALKAVQPKGCFRFENNLTGRLEGAKYVTVQVNWWYNTSSTTTDRDGNYVIPRGYQFKPIYRIFFQNPLYGFQIYENVATLAPAVHDMQTQDNHGYSKDFYTNSGAWDWIAINNAALTYFDECKYRNYALEPSGDLRIYCVSNQETSSAPMLSKINAVFDINSNQLSEWCEGYLRINPAWMRALMPDITVGTVKNSFKWIFEVVTHELSHASHFRQVGAEYWAEYIRYILYCWNNDVGDLYGFRNTPGNGVCGVGEMWGYFSGYWVSYLNYFNFIYPNGYDGEYPDVDNWFKPQVLWDIVNSRLLTPKEIFACMTPEVKSISQFRSKLFVTYPDIFLQINDHFHRYGYGRAYLTGEIASLDD